MNEYFKEIQHVGISAADMDATKAFYTKMEFDIAFETINDGAKVIFFRSGKKGRHNRSYCHRCKGYRKTSVEEAKWQ